MELAKLPVPTGFGAEWRLRCAPLQQSSADAVLRKSCGSGRSGASISPGGLLLRTTVDAAAGAARSLVVERVLNELPCVTGTARLAVPATARSAELEGTALDEEWAPC